MTGGPIGGTREQPRIYDHEPSFNSIAHHEHQEPYGNTKKCSARAVLGRQRPTNHPSQNRGSVCQPRFAVGYDDEIMVWDSAAASALMIALLPVVAIVGISLNLFIRARGGRSFSLRLKGFGVDLQIDSSQRKSKEEIENEEASS